LVQPLLTLASATWLLPVFRSCCVTSFPGAALHHFSLKGRMLVNSWKILLEQMFYPLALAVTTMPEFSFMCLYLIPEEETLQALTWFDSVISVMGRLCWLKVLLWHPKKLMEKLK